MEGILPQKVTQGTQRLSRKLPKLPLKPGIFICRLDTPRELILTLKTSLGAEKGGFEPPMRLPPFLISSQVHSTTLPLLQ